MSDIPPAGSMQLFDQVAPVMQGGLHRITTTVSFENAPGATDLTHHDFYEVGGSGVTLAPTEILAGHPPRDATGSFADVLPHVVLARRTLPWERAVLPGLDDPFAQPPDDDPRRAPWLALVVFRADEADVRGRVRLSDAVGSRAEQFAADGVPRDAIVDAVTVHDAGLLRRVLPTARELRLLAHVRRVNTADSALDMADDDGWLAVVTANRLPRPVDGQPTRHLAALVSLEHRDDLYGDGGDVFPGLLCLYSWSFTTDVGGDFATLAGNLNAGLFGAAAPADGQGRVTLRRTDRAGEAGQAGYRGPLAPVPGPLPQEADDVPYTAARELGRLLGAADPMVAPELVEWHRSASAAVTRDVQHAPIRDALAAAGTAPRPPASPPRPAPAQADSPPQPAAAPPSVAPPGAVAPRPPDAPPRPPGSGPAGAVPEPPDHIRTALAAVEALLDRLAPPAPLRRAAPVEGSRAPDDRPAAADVESVLVHGGTAPATTAPDSRTTEDRGRTARLARLASHRRAVADEERR